MKSDAAERHDEIKARMQQRGREMDAKAAAKDADWAEADAEAAINYAAWIVETACYDVLDAIDARAYADERAALAASE